MNKKNEAFGKELKYKRTDLWGREKFGIFRMHQNTITSHSRPLHNNACFVMGMHGNGIFMHPV
jgi:hypothetical protein